MEPRGGSGACTKPRPGTELCRQSVLSRLDINGCEYNSAGDLPDLRRLSKWRDADSQPEGRSAGDGIHTGGHTSEPVCRFHTNVDVPRHRKLPWRERFADQAVPGRTDVQNQLHVLESDRS